MFSRHLHPSPLGFALGLVLVVLWAAVWIGILATVSFEARIRSTGAPGQAQVTKALRPAA
jgi:hypothetical protein